jgi:cell wall-associated NlpC family hydrolase
MKALSLIGVPYRYGGDSPQTGFDCSGLVRHVFGQVAGFALPYDARGMSELGEQVPRDELQPGDLVFFNTLRRPYSHVGIYVGERRFVHAPSTGGAVEVVDMAKRYWRERYNGARRLQL